MKEPNIIKKRDKRTVNRLLKKEFYDSLITLSASNGDYKTVRLLDEGAFTYSDGSLNFVISKGTFEKFLNGENEYLDNITDDYVGSINLGHQDFASFPILLGSWTKEDLTLVDNENGRKGLDVKLRLDDESIFVKELKRMPYTLAVSAEFYYHMNDEMSEELGCEVLDEILITDYAIVGDGGNVGSNNIELKGDDKSMAKEVKKSLDTEDLESKVDETEVEETEVEEAEVEETEVEAEVETEATEEEAEVESEDESGEVSLKEQMLETIETLKKELEETKNELKETKEKLSAIKSEDEKFAEKFKNLTVELADKPEEKKQLCTDNYAGTDGIGE